jgi:hypothetical protein
MTGIRHLLNCEGLAGFEVRPAIFIPINALKQGVAPHILIIYTVVAVV